MFGYFCQLRHYAGDLSTQVDFGHFGYVKVEDAKSCSNYWGIKLLSHIMKIWKSDGDVDAKEHILN